MLTFARKDNKKVNEDKFSKYMLVALLTTHKVVR